MEQLTEEQIKRIECSRAAALRIKEQKKLLQSAKQSGSMGNKFNSEINVRGETEKRGDGNAKIMAVCKVLGDSRFIVDMPYHASSVNMFKTINGRKYETDLKKWSFPLIEHPNVASQLRAISPEIVVNAIPESLVKVLIEPDPSDSVFVNWYNIDKTLRDSLLQFQIEGIKFGIEKNGRCLIADDMGLGKTIQALGIAHYFKENWPLLIVCPSSMRYPWQDAINTFLPCVKDDVQVVTAAKDVIQGNIVILSYDLMKNLYDNLLKKRFGVIIYDESHCLKSLKSVRTTTALQLASRAQNLILLSGTPALSRPQELFSQIYMIDPHTFKKFFDFGIRYCDGKKEKYGWNFSGSSNLEELEVYLKKKIMIRRLKSEVIKQLPSKIRKVVLLHPNTKTLTDKMKKLESDYIKQEGSEKQQTLLSYYTLTGNAKLNAVCEYIQEKLEGTSKFLVFAHHNVVMNGICLMLQQKSVDFVRIDGGIGPQLRKDYCDRFQTVESCRVAVLSIKAANCGITLTAAHLVIFAELYWNPGELTQAEDRAHRIGQQDSVVVEYLIAKGTADEHLWKIIEKKLCILNKVGLSKESFKDSDVRQLGDPKQPKITSMFPTITPEKKTDKTETDLLMTEADNDKTEADLLMTEANNEKTETDLLMTEADDDIFNNINLEEIENEYLSTKRRKTGD